MALAQEFRFAARMLARNKGWTAVAVLTLALGLGANIAIFSVVGLMVWTPLPYPHPEQLAYIPQTNLQRGFSQAGVSLRDTRDWASASTVASIAAYQSRPMAISGQGEPQHLPAMQVSPEFFPTLGVMPVLGRAFTASESPETESRVAVISHELWQGMYRGEAGVLGRDIRLDGRNYSIVGVMPEGFQYLYQRMDVWISLSLDPSQRERGSRGLNNVARLKPGVAVAQAGAQVRSISERMEQEDSKSGQGWRGDVRPLADRIIPSGARAAAGTMFGAMGLVLLIACANVASLLLARGAQRRREFALRASLGAGRGALIRLQLAESLLLSALGGAAGVLSAVWTIPLLKRIAPPDMTILQTASLDWNAFAFGLGLSLLTGIVFGVVPAWLLTSGDLAPRLQEASRGSTGGRHVMLKSLVAGEMALALVLVAASTLMIRSLVRQFSMDPGFDKTNLVAAQVLLSAARYPDRTQVVDFYSRTLDNLRHDGSIQSAALVQTIPLGGSNNYSGVRVEGETDAKRDQGAGDMIVSPGYYQTMRIPLLTGRDFTDADNADARKVVIVNETFVKRYWPKTSNPVGQRVRMGGEQAPWLTVVGLARDVRHTSPINAPRPEVYRPHRQTATRNMMLVARGRGGAQTAAGALRSAVGQVDREQPLFRFQSVEALLFNRSAGQRATTEVLGLLAAVALALAAVGAYGVMAYTAAQRVREIGIRLALGATQQDVFRMVLGGGFLLAAIGVGIGLPAAYGVTPLLRAVDSGVDAADGLAYIVVALVLFAVALGASAVPAWRVMRVDPASVLRNE
jgi:putative ABC transport system permease protein